jgi:molybdate transport system regulatory protein
VVKRIAFVLRIDIQATVHNICGTQQFWDTINMINNLAEKPLVDRLTGGKGGGGTSLTVEGKQVIRQFKTIQEEHRKFLNNLEERLGDTEGLYQFLRRISMKVSARNTFTGIVTAITQGAVNAEVTLSLKAGIPLTAVVTNGAISNLGLKVGAEAYAIIKASSIIIGSDLDRALTSLADSKVTKIAIANPKQARAVMTKYGFVLPGEK